MVIMNKLNFNKETIYTYLKEIKDPEIPVLSIVDLGIVRDVKINTDGLEIVITATYTGCPAMDMIATDIRMQLNKLGFTNLKISTIISPAWTTDWISDAGKIKLKNYGIAPPNKRFLIASNGVECPRCQSINTKLISEFGSTACKAMFQCDDCCEPFDYFKCH